VWSLKHILNFIDAKRRQTSATRGHSMRGRREDYTAAASCSMKNQLAINYAGQRA